jgi:hypothetical protein
MQQLLTIKDTNWGAIKELQKYSYSYMNGRFRISKKESPVNLIGYGGRTGIGISSSLQQQQPYNSYNIMMF